MGDACIAGVHSVEGCRLQKEYIELRCRLEALLLCLYAKLLHCRNRIPSFALLQVVMCSDTFRGVHMRLPQLARAVHKALGHAHGGGKQAVAAAAAAMAAVAAAAPAEDAHCVLTTLGHMPRAKSTAQLLPREESCPLPPPLLMGGGRQESPFARLQSSAESLDFSAWAAHSPLPTAASLTSTVTTNGSLGEQLPSSFLPCASLGAGFAGEAARSPGGSSCGGHAALALRAQRIEPSPLGRPAGGSAGGLMLSPLLSQDSVARALCSSSPIGASPTAAVGPPGPGRLGARPSGSAKASTSGGGGSGGGSGAGSGGGMEGGAEAAAGMDALLHGGTHSLRGVAGGIGAAARRLLHRSPGDSSVLSDLASLGSSASRSSLDVLASATGLSLGATATQSDGGAGGSSRGGSGGGSKPAAGDDQVRVLRCNVIISVAAAAACRHTS